VKDPLISCIVPVYNGVLYLREALDSIEAQTYTPVEIMVVDDGSTDGTADIIASYGERIKHVYQPNSGPAAACNTGMRSASGEFFAFLAADDLWHEEKLVRQMNRFRYRPEMDASVTHIRNFWTPELREEEIRLQNHRLSQPMPGYTSVTLLARRSAFERVGYFNEALQHGNDLEWFLRAAEYGAVVELLPDVLAFRRLHRANRSRRLAEDSRQTFLKIVKASLDRRRGRMAPSPEG
jgi:glycosyltransferase involved in cell wall biosynthesis